MSETSPTRRNPYPGLRPFEQDDKDVFFGRQSHVDELLRRVESSRSLVVAGPSGSGKSSLVRAGLLPVLSSGGPSVAWRIVLLRPGTAPIKRLAQELVRAFPSNNILESETVRRDRLEANLCADSQGLVDTLKTAGQNNDEHCLVVVDAFEELFYLGDPDENSAFVKMLFEAAHHDSVSTNVLITLGSDFLGDCARFKGLPEAINEALYLIPRLSQVQLREAVEGPAGVAGGMIDPEIVDRVLHDAEEEEEPLPALQYVLRRIWSSTEAIGVGEYDAMGGMAQVIARDADGALDELSKEQARVARKVFQCITYKMPDHRGVSRPTHFGEIPLITGESESLVRQVVEGFRVSSRALMTPAPSEVLQADTLIEIRHENLIHKWPILRTWVDQEYSAVDAYRWLMQSADRHAQGREGLWNGAALEFAVEKITRKEWNPYWAKRLGGNYGAAISFVEESLRGRKADPESKDLRTSLNRTRVFAVVFGVLFVASLGLAFYAHQRQSEALAKRDETNPLLSNALQEQDAATRSLNRENLERDEVNRQRNAALRQKDVAERQRKIAESRQRIAENQRRLAESEGKIAEARKSSDRQLLYVANMNLADRAFDEGNLARGQELLNAYLLAEAAQTSSVDDDVRSFFWYYLWRNNHQELATLRGHGNPIGSVAFSPDGKLLATGSGDGSVKLWNPATRQQLATLKGGGNAVSSVVFSPDGRILATASRDGSVKLWDAGASEERATLAGPGGDIFAAAFGPDGKVFAAGSKDGAVTLWDIETRTQLASLEGHKRDVYAVAFSSDGKTLATGSQDDTVKLWDVASRKEVATLEGQGDDVHAVAFSPDGGLLATGSKNGAVKLWDVVRRKELVSLEGARRDVYTVAFSPNGLVLVAGSRNGVVRLWDVATRKELETLKGHGDAVSSAAFAPKGQVLATGSRDGSVKLWALDTRKERATLAGKTPIFSVAFAPEGKRLATGSVADTVRLWDLESRDKPVTLKGAGDVLFSVAFSPNGTMLATGSKDGTAKLWELATGKVKEVFKGHGAVVFSVAFSPDGKTLATGSWDRTIKLWDVVTGKEIANLEGHDDAVFSVAFSPDGKILATGSKDTTVKIWDVAAGKELATLAGHADAVFPVAFSPDGTTLATASRDGIVKLWEVATRDEVGMLKGHVDSVSSVFFSPDGKTLATGSLDDTVKLWDLVTRQELATLRGHSNDVYSVAFSPDGKVLATGSLDGAVKLWEATTDAEVAQQR